jgi:hypothetical protein
MTVYIPRTPWKYCGGCDRDKHLWAFNHDATKYDGRCSRCKTCKNERNRAYHRAHRAEILERKRDYDREHHNAAWREAHQDEISEYNRAHHRDHREQIRERKRSYYQGLRRQVLDHYGWECACCGVSDDLTIDHVDGDGAEHRIELFGNRSAGTQFYLWLVRNDFPDDIRVQVLCVPCNSSKGTGERCRMHRSTTRP